MFVNNSTISPSSSSALLLPTTTTPSPLLPAEQTRVICAQVLYIEQEHYQAVSNLSKPISNATLQRITEWYTNEILQLLSYFNLTETFANECRYRDLITHRTKDIVFLVCFTLIFIIGATSNGVVFGVLFKQRRRRKSRINFHILHLSLADLVVSVITCGVEIGWRIFIDWRAGDLMCRLVAFLRPFGVYASSNLVVCIAIDRLFAVVAPMKFSTAIRRSRIMVTGAWLIAAAYSAPQLYIFHVEALPELTQYRQCVTYGSYPSKTFENLYNIFCMTAMFYGPLLVIIIVYAIILWKIHNTKLASEAANVDQAVDHHKSVKVFDLKRSGQHHHHHHHHILNGNVGGGDGGNERQSSSSETDQRTTSAANHHRNLVALAVAHAAAGGVCTRGGGGGLHHNCVHGAPCKAISQTKISSCVRCGVPIYLAPSTNFICNVAAAGGGGGASSNGGGIFLPHNSNNTFDSPPAQLPPAAAHLVHHHHNHHHRLSSTSSFSPPPPPLTLSSPQPPSPAAFVYQTLMPQSQPQLAVGAANNATLLVCCSECNDNENVYKLANGTGQLITFKNMKSPLFMRVSTTSTLGRAKSRAFRLTCIIVFAFVFSFAPYILVNTWRLITENFARTTPQEIEEILLLFAVCNSIVNPVIYGFVSRTIKNEISSWRIFRRSSYEQPPDQHHPQQQHKSHPLQNRRYDSGYCYCPTRLLWCCHQKTAQDELEAHHVPYREEQIGGNVQPQHQVPNHSFGAFVGKLMRTGSTSTRRSVNNNENGNLPPALKRRSSPPKWKQAPAAMYRFNINDEVLKEVSEHLNSQAASNASAADSEKRRQQQQQRTKDGSDSSSRQKNTSSRTSAADGDSTTTGKQRTKRKPSEMNGHTTTSGNNKNNKVPKSLLLNSDGTKSAAASNTNLSVGGNSNLELSVVNNNILHTRSEPVSTYGVHVAEEHRALFDNSYA